MPRDGLLKHDVTFLSQKDRLQTNNDKLVSSRALGPPTLGMVSLAPRVFLGGSVLKLGRAGAHPERIDPGFAFVIRPKSARNVAHESESMAE